jgi:hypothetical protein
MRKHWRLIVGCVVLGLTVTGLIALYIGFVGEFDVTLYSAFAILCPPSLVWISLNNAMEDKRTLYAIWSLVGLANAGLYAIVGVAIAELLGKP